MVTVVLSNMNGEVLVRHYETESHREANRLLLDDWIAGEITWERASTNEALTPEWLSQNGEELDRMPEYRAGTVIYDFHYCGPTEGDDEIVYAQMIRHRGLDPFDGSASVSFVNLGDGL